MMNHFPVEFAYRQLQVEMTRLLQLVQESQQNQHDFMTEAAKLMDRLANQYQEVRNDVVSLSISSDNRYREKRSELNEPAMEKLVQISQKLDQVIFLLAQSNENVLHHPFEWRPFSPSIPANS